MNKLRKNLINRMIQLYGSENKIVIDFRHCCEIFPNDEAHDKTLRTLVLIHEECPVIEEEDK